MAQALQFVVVWILAAIAGWATANSGPLAILAVTAAVLATSILALLWRWK